MSDVTAYDYDYKDTTVQTILDYFGEQVKFETLVDMSNEELDAYLQQLYETVLDNGMADATWIADFEEAFQNELDEIYLAVYTAYKDLNKLLDSGQLSSADEASIEMLQKDLQEWLERADVDDDENGVYEIWEDMQAEVDGRNIDVGAEGYTFEDGSSYKTGDVVTVTVTVPDDTAEDESSTMGENDSDLWDSDGDGYGDTEVVRDEDGRVTEDYNGDGTIDEKDDPNYEAPADAIDLFVDVEDGTTIDVASSEYDDATDTYTVMYSFTREDGTVYYVKYVITGIPDINDLYKYVNFVFIGSMGNLTPTEISKWPTYLAQAWFESTATQSTGMSFYVAVLGGEKAETEGDYYTIYNMDDYETDEGNNIVEIEPDQTDYEQGRVYVVNCDENDQDIINIDAEGAEISFSADADGNLVMTLTTEDGSVTIVFKGLIFYAIDTEGTVSDYINIEGGTISYDEYANIDEISIYDSWSDGYNTGLLFHMIYHDEENLADIADEDGYERY